MEHLSLGDTIVFLVAAGLVVPVFKSLRLSPVLGFITVGIFVGPYGLVSLTGNSTVLDYILITDREGIRALAELGVIFLLFLIGLDLSFNRLWGMRKLVLGMGNVQILVTALVIGAIAYAWGNSLEAAIILGGCLALSSTAIVLQLLVDQGRFSSPAGHASFAILLAQDLAVVPLLFLVGSFVETAATSTGADASIAIVRALITMTIIYVVGRTLLRPLFRFVGRLNTPELFMATTLLVVIATASITHQVGLSAALGAFLAGLLLSESEYRHDIELYIEPFKGLLLGLFFISVAMDIDLGKIAANPVWILLSVIGLIGIKATVTTLSARIFGFSWQHATETGILLGQGGEFAFVVIGLALSFALLPSDTAQFMLIVVSATMFVTPLLAAASHRVANWVGKFAGEGSAVNLGATPSEHIEDHVILVGYGRTGQLLSHMLNQHMVPFITIDRNADLTKGDPETSVHIGDAARTQTLQKFQIDKAQALVICINEADTVKHIIAAARRLEPDIPILVRTRDEHQALDLLQSGASVVVPEVLESGLQLAGALLAQLEVPKHAAGDIVAQLREQAQSKIS